MSAPPNDRSNEAPVTPYQSLVASQTLRNPCLRTLSEFLSDGVSCQKSCRIACVEFSSISDAPCTKSIDLANLSSLLNCQNKRRSDPEGRLLIVEDLSRDVIEVLGSTLNIDPFFFASHLDLPQPDITATQPYMTLLPSTARSQKFLTLHYHRVLELKHVVSKEPLFRDMNVPRKVKILPPTKGLTLGLARHCCSILESVGKDGSWLGVILVDVSIDTPSVLRRSDGFKMMATTVQSQLFQGGFEDFISGTPLCDKMIPKSGPRRRSLLEDLIFYWHNEKPPGFDVTSPTLLSLCYYPLRIVAAEWMVYLEVMYHSTKHFEYAPNTTSLPVEQIAVLNTNLIALQKWARRSEATSHKLRYVVNFLKCQNATDELCDLLIKDYEHIRSSIDMYGHRLESMVPIVTSMIQIIDSQRSLLETANIARLSNLALLFVPLTFVSSLFSMSDGMTPGSKHFWIYFVVAIPLCMLVFFVARPPTRIFEVLEAWALKSRKRSEAAV